MAVRLWFIDQHVHASRYLKQTALRLRDDFDSDVSKTVDELCSLSGVGPKLSSPSGKDYSICGIK